MKIPATLLLLLISISSTAQKSEAYAKKLAARMCQCAAKVTSYEELKPQLELCFDTVMNAAPTKATADENLIIENTEQFKQVKEKASLLVLTDCAHVKKLVEAEARSKPVENAYPVNFGPEELKKATKNPEHWNGNIVAFEGTIIEIKKPSEDKPYMKVKLRDGQTVWVGSMVKSEFDQVGNTIRFLGYFTLTKPNDFARKYHTEPFHILAFAELAPKSKQLVFLPGSEAQVKEWSQGRIPEKIKIEE